MQTTKMIPLDSLLKDIYLVMRQEDVNEDLIMEFGIRALEHLRIYKTYDYAVCVLKVENNQVDYPNGMLGIEHVLYMKDSTYMRDRRFLVTDDILSFTETSWNVVEIEHKYVSKVSDLVGLTGRMQNVGWQYLPLSDRNFDKSIICNPNLPRCNECGDWWLPDNVRERFITSFETGYIAVTYYRYPQNEEGQYLIMDEPFLKDAIEAFVLSKTYQRLWNMSVDGAQQKYTHYSQKWSVLANAAIGELMRLSLPEIINMDRMNTLFKKDNIQKVLGGYGKEQTKMW